MHLSSCRTAAVAAALVTACAALTATAAQAADPVTRTIEEIQGTGATSPFVGEAVLTSGVVTASWPTGGLDGFTIAAAGSGGRLDPATHRASDGLFVYLGAGATPPAVGSNVSVAGTVSEFHGLTELQATAGGVTPLTGAVVAPRPAAVAWPRTEAEREALESMTITPLGRYTVTDNYATNQYGTLGLARGRTPLHQPTDVALPGAPARAVARANAARAVTLDDGATTNYLPFGGGPTQDLPLPYLDRRHPDRVGAPVTFTRPVVVDYRYDAWTLQPTSPLTATGPAPVRIADTRTPRPRRVGGDVRVASFNVLNYFPETGADWVAAGGTCSYHLDRDGEPVTVDTCSGDGPRGAADLADFRRQQAKIVSAINRLGADVLSLEEIENSAHYAGVAHRDRALHMLVRALNTAAHRPVWALVPSPRRQPALSDQDVIRTAFIYRRAVVRPVGGSQILTGSPAFADAREPLAQRFRARTPATRPFLVVANHFKSKGSGVDDHTGQGLANPDRVRQADALVDFVGRVQRATRTARVFLVGDFNAYTREAPVRRLVRAGYADVGARFTHESTYAFDGMVGSLDHVLVNRAALRSVVGADVWNVNSVESVAFEYSRLNVNVTRFYSPGPFRASDHDPLLVGIRAR